MSIPFALDLKAFDNAALEAKKLHSADSRDEIVTHIYQTTQTVCDGAITYPEQPKLRSQTYDKILTSPIWGFPIMLAMLGIVIYLTIAGANVPSNLLAQMFGVIEGYLTAAFNAVHAPGWLHGLLVLGLYRGTAWVISVMLPPMAIFFPMFALLENLGYLPRVAFNMDRLFKKSGGHGKQSLTMAMGFGCNAAAIVSTRIIESPRERMLAILTNNFVPCNGRWPMLILLSSLFMAAGYTGGFQTFVTASIVVGMVLFGIVVTLTVSWVLSKTALRGVPTHYTLELPPYRRPKFWNTVIRSSVDKSWSVLKRAVVIAAPAGLITWILANITVGDLSVLEHMAAFFDPFARSLGMDGFILMAFILGLPANEIVLPILLMGYLATGAMVDADGMAGIKNIFVAHGWTWLTALNTMLFSLLHYPCGTTLFTIYKETKSAKWTFLSFAIPTVIAIAVTFVVAQVVRGLGLV
ncbi:nucleoside recognition domain-containing protein [Numidum massiliense]|uniref:nucleoside recognition domain-containing protein n=1 Tax=Numidum massiliense TaxID=1522315 RepID=UPI0006D56EC2|nr:nucleoside recognition domain-containing protein [Numidum massiliense]